MHFRLKRLAFSDLEDEFLYFLLYLRCLATAPLERDVLIKKVSEAHVFPAIRSVFNKINVLVRHWNMPMSRVLRRMADNVKSRSLREFLQRFSESIEGGEPIEHFIKREYVKHLTLYEDIFKRNIDRLKHISDAFISVESSSTLLIISVLLTAMLTALPLIVPLIVVVSIPLASLMLSLVIQKLSRAEHILARVRSKSKKRLLIEILSIISPSIGSLMGGVYLINDNFLYFTLCLGISMLIPGICGKIFLRRVKKMEEKYYLFLRNFNASYSSNVPLYDCLRACLITDYGILNKPLRKMFSRINMGFRYEECFRAFEDETNSKLIKRLNFILFDSMLLGGNIEECGRVIDSFYVTMTTLRKRRSHVVGYFRGLVIPLYIVLSAICGVMNAILAFFHRFTGILSKILGTSSVLALSELNLYFMLMIVLIAISNAIAIYLMEGEARFNILFYLGLNLVLGGIVYSLATDTVSKYFEAFKI